MFALVQKDFRLMKSSFLIFGLMVCVFSWLTGTSAFSGFSYLSVLLPILCMNTMSYDELATWDAYAAATPAGRSGTVKGKYLFLVILAALGLALECLTFLVAQQLNYVVPLSTYIDSLMATLGGLCAAAFLYPIIFAFGVTKSRVALGVVFGLIVMIATFFSSLNINLPGTSIPADQQLLVACLVSFALVGLSYGLSRALYARREL